MHDHRFNSTHLEQGFQHLIGMAKRLQGFTPETGGRARRGDVRTAILLLLAEQPMHGYQVIHELSERSDGIWNPSAGSVYPTLQLLADEGLVAVEPSGGKKVYRLTDAGRAVADTLDPQSAPWQDAAASASGGSGYHRSAGRLLQAVVQVGKLGSPTQLTAASEVLDDARRRLFSILSKE